MERGHLVAAAAVLALAAGAGAWYSRSAPEPPPIAVAVGPAAAGPFTVHVSGAVVAPGLIEVPPGARVADAVAAAGGALPGAELSALNLAAPVGDGQQLLVPQESGASAAGGAVATGKVRVNTAGAAELELLPGVGPVLAERILQHRESFGPFSVVEDLLDVPGIGEGKLAALRDAVQIP
ncbi:MAG: ComEA family DNA-binding protein [Acidimicrobiia bacterium]|nr:ComEA family DNA-binding protein [Acidimicrobiia bacterium]